MLPFEHYPELQQFRAPTNRAWRREAAKLAKKAKRDASKLAPKRKPRKRKMPILDKILLALFLAALSSAIAFPVLQAIR